MSEHGPNTVIIVEGLTDKKQVEKVIDEDVTIVCTHGTFGIERFDELLETYDLDHKEVFILVDEDKAGIQLRKQLARELRSEEHTSELQSRGHLVCRLLHAKKKSHIEPVAARVRQGI